MRLETARDEFVAFKRGATKRNRPASRETLRSYKSRLTVFIDWVRAQKGKSSTQDMSSQLVRDYIDHSDELRRSGHTVSLDATVIREFAMWGAAAERRYWRWEAVSDIPSRNKPETLPRPYTAPERDALMALALPLDEQVLRGLLYFAGLRRSEACGLRLQDVTPPTRLPDKTMLPGRLRIFGKGAKERVVEIHDDLWAVLDAHIGALPKGTRLERHVLVKFDGTPWTGQMVQRHVRAWGKAAGVEGPKAHRMRHTFASDMYEATEDILAVKELLGHSSVATTQVYAKLSNRRRWAAVRALASNRALSSTIASDSASSPVLPSEVPDKAGENQP